LKGNAVTVATRLKTVIGNSDLAFSINGAGVHLIKAIKLLFN